MEEAEEATASASNLIKQQTPWFDENDLTGVYHAISPKDSANVVNGVATYGPWELVQYLDSLIYDLWVECASMNGIGLGYGLIMTAGMTRLVLTPFILNSQLVSHKYKLLGPDMDEVTANMKRY